MSKKKPRDRRSRKITFILSAVLFLIVSAAFFNIYDYAMSELPEGVMYERMEAYSGVTCQEIRNIRGGNGTDPFQLYTKGVSASVEERCQVEIVGVNANTRYHITPEIVQSRNCYVAISESMARDIFLNLNVIGQKVSINGQKYTICGTYPDTGSFWSDIARDHVQRIYVPYTCMAPETEIDKLISETTIIS